jgi:hypothetical protein
VHVGNVEAAGRDVRAQQHSGRLFPELGEHSCPLQALGRAQRQSIICNSWTERLGMQSTGLCSEAKEQHRDLCLNLNLNLHRANVYSP